MRLNYGREKRKQIAQRYLTIRWRAKEREDGRVIQGGIEGGQRRHGEEIGD